MNKLLVATIPLAALISTPAFSSDDELLRAALKKIESLDGRMSALEAENKTLRAALGRNKVAVEKIQMKSAPVSLKRENVPSVSPAASSPTAISHLAQYNGEQPLPALSQWSGIYAGFNAGYSVGYIDQFLSAASFYGTTLNQTGYSKFADNFIQGGAAGGQLGYMYTLSNRAVLGVEADINWTDINDLNARHNLLSLYNDSGFNVFYGSNGATAAGYNCEACRNSVNSYGRLGLNWMGTVRARIGYDMGNLLPYLTGGFAYGNLSQSYGAYLTDGTQFAGTITGDKSIIASGWVAGAGLEYMAIKNWSLKGEYLYTQLGGISMPVSYVENNGYRRDIATYSTGSFGFHQFRIGINYHTGWLGDATAITGSK